MSRYLSALLAGISLFSVIAYPGLAQERPAAHPSASPPPASDGRDGGAVGDDILRLQETMRALKGEMAREASPGGGRPVAVQDIPVSTTVPVEVPAVGSGDSGTGAPADKRTSGHGAVEGGGPVKPGPAPRGAGMAVPPAGGNSPAVVTGSQLPAGVVASTPVPDAERGRNVPTGKRAATDSTVALPGIPAQTLRDARQPEGQAPIEFGSVQSAMSFTVKPGETQIVPVALGHLNRLVTPFPEVAVVTTSDAKTRVSGNVVYVSTTQPATIFLTPKGNESIAIGVALVPRSIPPLEVTFKLPDGVSVPRGQDTPSTRSAAWERSQPFVVTIRSIMRDIANGRTPPGFGIRSVQPQDMVPYCDAPAGIEFGFSKGQVVSGNSTETIVGKVTNTGPVPIELQEPWCGTEGVAGVAFWPRNMLEPGQETEIFVIRRPRALVPAHAIRPSLLTDAPRGNSQ